MNKQIPKFKNEDEERDFWSKNDSSEFLDWSGAKSALIQNLKLSDFLNLGKFDILIQQVRKQAKEAGLKRKDIKTAIAKVRGRKG
jgi:hypothetical protein